MKTVTSKFKTVVVAIVLLMGSNAAFHVSASGFQPPHNASYTHISPFGGTCIPAFVENVNILDYLTFGHRIAKNLGRTPIHCP